jgi:hypothetical protein
MEQNVNGFWQLGKIINLLLRRMQTHVLRSQVTCTTHTPVAAHTPHEPIEGIA